jgi:hypothetical protein
VEFLFPNLRFDGTFRFGFDGYLLLRIGDTIPASVMAWSCRGSAEPLWSHGNAAAIAILPHGRKGHSSRDKNVTLR